MATNPMKRKSRNMFLLGMLITMILAGGVIAFLIMQMNKINEEMAYVQSGSVSVLTRDVKSGEIITQDMFKQIKMHPNMTPANSQGVMAMINDYMVDQNGNKIYGDAEGGFYYLDGNSNQINIFKGNDNKYYVKNGSNNVEVQILGSPAVAKIDIKANTAVTTDMLTTKDQAIAKDVRLEEYNMLELPIDLQNGEYIDVRLRLGTGQEFIVISKKEVKKCDETTIWIEVSEEEMLTMSNAMIESYIMPSSKLHAVRYVEPGIQVAAIPTYPVSQAVNDAIRENPNILQEAKDAYQSRISTKMRQAIEAELSKDAEDRKDNIEDKVEEEITKSLESRSQYIEELDVR